jgi:hypothetical protein
MPFFTLPGIAAGFGVGKLIGDKKKKTFAKAAAEGAKFENEIAAFGPVDDSALPELQKKLTVAAPDFSKLIAEREKQAGGFTAPEAEAMRARMALGLQGQEAAQRRALAASQARAGVRGGAMSAQAARLALGQGQQRAAGEQELFLKNIAEQQRRFGELEKLRKDEMFAQQAATLAAQDMAQRELTSRRQAIAAIRAAREASRKK